MSRLFVDGYNIIRQDARLHELERRNQPAARAELVRLLNHSSLSRYTVVLVFDGTAPSYERLPRGRVRLVYSRDRSADEVIAASCGGADIVATNDRGLSEETLRAGPRIWSVDTLLGKVRPRSRRQTARAVNSEKPRATKLRGFDVCPRCKFYNRDDWLMLCEEDSAAGKPRNFRTGW